MNRDTMTTVLGAVFAVLQYLATVGADYPHDAKGWFHVGVSAALAAFGYLAFKFPGIAPPNPVLGQKVKPENVTPKILVLALLLPSLVGCSTVVNDLTKAKARADAAVAAGLLPSSDPLPMCLGALVAEGPALGVLSSPFAGIVDFGVDLYIIDSRTQAGSPELEQKCAPVAWKILRNGVRRMPGL